MDPHKVNGHPDDGRVACKGDQGAGKNEVAQDRVARQKAHHLFKGRGLRRRRRGAGLGRSCVAHPPRRLGHGEANQQGQGNAGQANNEEGSAPPKELVHPTTHEKAEEDAPIHPGAEDRHGRGSPLRGVKVRNHGVGGWIRARLSYPHTDAQKQKLEVIARHSTEGCHERPQEDREGDKISPIISVRPHSHGHAQGGIEQGEHDP